MSKRKNKATFITANFENYDYKDVVNIVENILQYVNYNSKNKDYCYNILVGVSIYSNNTNYYYEITEKKGRPRKNFYNDNICIPYKDRFNIPPEIVKTHIHMLILGCPGETITQMIKQYLEKRYNLKFLNKTVLEKIKRQKGTANNNKYYNSILTIGNLQELIYKIHYIYRQSKEIRKTKDKNKSIFRNIDYEDIEKNLQNMELYEFFSEELQRMIFINVKPNIYKLLKYLFFEN